MYVYLNFENKKNSQPPNLVFGSFVPNLHVLSAEDCDRVLLPVVVSRRCPANRIHVRNSNFPELHLSLHIEGLQ